VVNHSAGHSWVGATAWQIARAVRRGDATAVGIVADHLAHAEIAERVLGVVGTLRAGSAIAEAEHVDEQPDLGDLPLAGVPVLVRETVPVAGLRGPHGVAGADHEVVRRLRGAGAVVLGTARAGPVRNPWHTDRSAGGCGAAAAVAMGIVPIAYGDAAPVRVPAACCGLVGFTPGTPDTPGLTAQSTATEAGVLATSVADVALGLDVLYGRRPAPLAEARRLRVAVSWRGLVPATGADPDARAGLRQVARALVELGHDVVLADPPARLAVAALFGGEAARADSRACGLAWFAEAGIDVVVQPTLAGPPPVLVGQAAAGRVPVPLVRRWLAAIATIRRFAPFTIGWNLAGFAALTLPLGRRRVGLPGAVQLTGPPGAEARLLALGARLEAVGSGRPHAPTWPRAMRMDRAGATIGA
jgi:amidase